MPELTSQTVVANRTSGVSDKPNTTCDGGNCVCDLNYQINPSNATCGKLIFK